MYEEEQSNESNSNGSHDSSEASPRSSRGSSGSSAPAKADFRCAYCGKYFVKAESKTLPFCSKRCQHIDLGMWLNESYGVPYEGDESTPPE